MYRWNEIQKIEMPLPHLETWIYRILKKVVILFHFLSISSLLIRTEFIYPIRLEIRD